MSGINTLIDTLVHQVLGKRVDTQAPRELNQPVKPLTPAEAPRALHSDSRLDQRMDQPLRRTGQVALERPSTRLGRQAGEQQRAPPTPSTQTSFTPTARSIADLLMRFPASSTALRASQPLMPANEAPAPTQVADRLQHSVRDSGLFYESHLSRWFRGELPKAQLYREPQMWRPLTFTQASTQPPAPTPMRTSWPILLFGLRADNAVGLGREQGRSPVSPTPATRSTPAQLMAAPGGGSAAAANASSGQASQMNAGEAREQVALTDRTAQLAHVLRPAPAETRQPIHESLQGIVRHQLELLATPVLRWEGDIWSGLFMALLVQPPAAKRDEGGASGEESGQEEEQPQAWHSSMVLQVSGFGEVDVKLWLQEARLELELAARDPNVHAALAQGIDRLKRRLEAQDLSEVLVRLRTLEQDSEPEVLSDRAG